jgi:hypothetical protein
MDWWVLVFSTLLCRDLCCDRLTGVQVQGGISIPRLRPVCMICCVYCYVWRQCSRHSVCVYCWQAVHQAEAVVPPASSTSVQSTSGQV